MRISLWQLFIKSLFYFGRNPRSRASPFCSTLSSKAFPGICWTVPSALLTMFNSLSKFFRISPERCATALQSNNPTFMWIAFCIHYFSIAMIKCHNQNQFIEEFILVYGIRGIELIMTRETRHGGKSHFLSHTKSRDEIEIEAGGIRNWGKAISSQTNHRWYIYPPPKKSHHLRTKGSDRYISLWKMFLIQTTTAKITN